MFIQKKAKKKRNQLNKNSVHENAKAVKTSCSIQKFKLNVSIEVVWQKFWSEFIVMDLLLQQKKNQSIHCRTEFQFVIFDQKFFYWQT